LLKNFSAIEIIGDAANPDEAIVKAKISGLESIFFKCFKHLFPQNIF
jgi:hypothetical protein